MGSLDMFYLSPFDKECVLAYSAVVIINLRLGEMHLIKGLLKSTYDYSKFAP